MKIDEQLSHATKELWLSLKGLIYLRWHKIEPILKQCYKCPFSDPEQLFDEIFRRENAILYNAANSTQQQRNLWYENLMQILSHLDLDDDPLLCCELKTHFIWMRTVADLYDKVLVTNEI